jgi:hypothetical protein
MLCRLQILSGRYWLGDGDRTGWSNCVGIVNRDRKGDVGGCSGLPDSRCSGLPDSRMGLDPTLRSTMLCVG